MTCMCLSMFSCGAELEALSLRSVPHDPHELDDLRQLSRDGNISCSNEFR